MSTMDTEALFWSFFLTIWTDLRGQLLDHPRDSPSCIEKGYCIRKPIKYWPKS